MNKLIPSLILSAVGCATLNASSITYTSKTAFTSASPVSLREDFEAAATKDAPLASYTSNGITYTGLAGVPSYNVYIASPGYNNFGAGVGLTTSSVLTGNGDEEFLGQITTGSPKAVGFDVLLNGLGPASVEFFNGNTSLGLITFSSGDGITFAGIVSDSPVTSFHFTSTLGGQVNTGIDNVLTSVPDGGPTATLLATGILSLFAVGRKYSKLSNFQS